MRPLLILLLLSVAAIAAPQNRILVQADGSFRGPYTHEEPPGKKEARVDLTEAQFAAVDALRRANPGKEIVFVNGEFTLAPAEQARAADKAERDALVAKLDAGTLTAAETRALLRQLARRLQKLEDKAER